MKSILMRKIIILSEASLPYFWAKSLVMWNIKSTPKTTDDQPDDMHSFSFSFQMTFLLNYLNNTDNLLLVIN